MTVGGRVIKGRCVIVAIRGPSGAQGPVRSLVWMSVTPCGTVQSRGGSNSSTGVSDAHHSKYGDKKGQG